MFFASYSHELTMGYSRKKKQIGGEVEDMEFPGVLKK